MYHTGIQPTYFYLKNVEKAEIFIKVKIFGIFQKVEIFWKNCTMVWCQKMIKTIQKIMKNSMHNK